MDEYYRKSHITGKEYNYFDTVMIKNINQAAAYIENEVFPVDIISSRDPVTNKRVLIYYFDRKETKEVFDKWCNYELK